MLFFRLFLLQRYIFSFRLRHQTFATKLRYLRTSALYRAPQFFLNFQGLRKIRPRVEPLTYQHRSFLKSIPYASGTNNCLLNQSLRWCYKQSHSTGIPMLDAGGTNTQLLYKSTPYHILGTSSCFLKPPPTLVSGGTNSCFINQLPMLEVRRVAFEINYSLRWWYISTLEVQPYGVGTDAADPYSLVV